MAERVRLLGVPIDALTQSEAVERILTFLAGDRAVHVMTPNSEMLVAASSMPEFHALLGRTALNLPDSVGLLKMATATGQHLPERVTGVDTVQALCARLDSNTPVFLLGAAPGVAEAAAAVLRQANPRLRIAGTHAGSPRLEDVEGIVKMINQSQPKLLLVAYGAPQQDLWIDQYLSQLPSVRAAMGVGGTFDVIAGRIKRAPALFRSLGLEWLWRLLLQPSRWHRIWTATVTFPRLVKTYGRELPLTGAGSPSK